MPCFTILSTLVFKIYLYTLILCSIINSSFFCTWNFTPFGWVFNTLLLLTPSPPHRILLSAFIKPRVKVIFGAIGILHLINTWCNICIFLCKETKISFLLLWQWLLWSYGMICNGISCSGDGGLPYSLSLSDYSFIRESNILEFWLWCIRWIQLN